MNHQSLQILRGFDDFMLKIIKALYMKVKKRFIKKLIYLFVIGSVIYACGNVGSKSENNTKEKSDYLISNEKIDTIFEKAIVHLNNSWDSVRVTGRFPRSIDKGFVPISDWTSGFYPGSLWIAYEHSQDPELLEKAKYATELLEEEKYNTKDHDIGFRMYCSYGRGYEFTNSQEYKNIIIQSAKSAIQRYNPKVKAIMSWPPREERDWQYPVIVDNMMNLELLFAVSKFTNDSTYYNVAVNHALTTMKNQYRKDFSCSHVVDYDSISGAFRKRDWNNGNNNPENAAWSRGQSWGLYGFTMMYRETSDEQYLKQAENIADFIINHPNMPEDMVPIWDFSAPDVSTIRDASAGAILASALMELSQLSKENGTTYFKAGEKLLSSLSSPEYFAEPNTNSDFIIKHAIGNFKNNSEMDGTLIYADYYFLEALLRYAKIKEAHLL